MSGGGGLEVLKFQWLWVCHFHIKDDEVEGNDLALSEGWGQKESIFSWLLHIVKPNSASSFKPLDETQGIIIYCTVLYLDITFNIY